MSLSLDNITQTQPKRLADELPAHNQGSPRWLVAYYVVQIASQLVPLISVFAGARVFTRIAAFGVSLIALFSTLSRTPRHRSPVAPLAFLVFGILLLEAVHPDTASGLGALATLGMYAAILGPVFWVPRLDLNLYWFRRVVITIWAFQSVSAFVGALQVYFPGVLQPAVASAYDQSALSGLVVKLANGDEILRPLGLTDTPGGAAGAGTYAILLSLGLWSNQPKPWFRVLLVLSIGVGMFVLYLCQIRSLVVMVGISVVAMAAVHGIRGRFRSLAGISIVMGLVAVTAFIAAVSVGGTDVTNRLTTLVDSSPTQVYYTNRGIFLERTLTELLPTYPLGAGLGRWGMMASYFGAGPGSTLYVEIQWTGWLLDGGVPMLLAYIAIFVITLRVVWRLARRQTNEGSDLTSWATMLVGYDIGTIALTFNFPVFMSTFGMDFWVLNSALLAVVAAEGVFQLGRLPTSRSGGSHATQARLSEP